MQLGRALGSAVDARCLDVPHRWYRREVLLGLLRARLGRLGFGIGGKRLAYAWLAGTALLHSSVVMGSATHQNLDSLLVHTPSRCR
jgi:hypothetical protein